MCERTPGPPCPPFPRQVGEGWPAASTKGPARPPDSEGMAVPRRLGHRRDVHRPHPRERGRPDLPGRQGAHHPRPARRRRRRGDRGGARRGARARRPGVARPPRHHALHERHHRAEGRPDRARHDQGLPRRGRDRPRAPLRHVRPLHAAAAADRAAPPPLRGRRAHAGRRHREAAGRLRRGAAPGGPAAVGGDRGGRRVLAPRVREPRSRAPGGDDPAGGAPGGRGHAVERAGAGDPRVRAHVDDARQRVRPAPGPALPGAAGRPAARGWRRRWALHHAVERRALRGRDGRPVPRPPDRVGPGGRRPRRGALRRAPRPQGPPVVRHGRHHRQGVRHRRRRAARLPRVRGRPPVSLQEGQRPPDQGPGDRDDRDRHRRGLDRPGRRAPPAPRRAGERGRAARGRWLRPRRHGADRDRRRPRAGLSRSRLLPRRADAARPGRRARTRSPSGSGGRSASVPWRPPGASTSSPTRAWRAPRASTRSSAARTSSGSRSSPSAAPGPCTPSAWPASSGARA